MKIYDDIKLIGDKKYKNFNVFVNICHRCICYREC
jgi:hypothetical protein